MAVRNTSTVRGIRSGFLPPMDPARAGAIRHAGEGGESRSGDQCRVFPGAGVLHAGGGWLRAGRWFGLSGGTLLYWIRFLNVFLVAGLVWIGYAAAKQTFPAERFVRLGVPTLVAILPQDAFYSIQNDVLSPVFFGLAFVGLVRWLRKPEALLSVGIGLSLATLCLVKVSNLPLIAVGILAVLLRAGAGKLRQTWIPCAGCAVHRLP